MDDSRRGKRPPLPWIGALVVLAIVWGGSIPATKLGLCELPPLTLTALRYLAAAPCFALLLLGQRLPPARALLALGGLGLLGIAVGQLAQALGVARTSAAVATVISATIPILIVLLAALRLRQPIALRHGVGLATAFVASASSPPAARMRQAAPVRMGSPATPWSSRRRSRSLSSTC